MAENPRIDDLRRRVQKDPTSIAFAQLAEECRRAGEYQEAVEVCRGGLEIHPGYLSARVTLGRALLALGELDEAQAELSRVLEGASDNLAAIRGLAEIHDRRGDLGPALVQYRAALLLAPNDPDLEDTVVDLSGRLELAGPVTAQEEEIGRDPRPEPLAATPALPVLDDEPPVPVPPPVAPIVPPAPELLGSMVPQVPEPDVSDTLTRAADDRAIRTVAALEHWLEAIHVARADRHP